MKRMTNLGMWIVTLTALAAPVTARGAVVQHYNILPSAEYHYLPSPEGPGITGCDPSNFDCAFSVAGQFTLEFAGPPDTVQFTNLELVLIGNEAIQNDPPLVAPVTADRVEAWLMARVFDEVPVAAPINRYVDSQFQTLSLTDFLNGTVHLVGGYDFRPVDGDGLDFNLMARLVPEPGTISVMTVGLMFCFSVRARTGR